MSTLFGAPRQVTLGQMGGLDLRYESVMLPGESTSNPAITMLPVGS